MDKDYLRTIWKQEESVAHIRGWDFSHIRGRYEAERDLPWNYRKIVTDYLKANSRVLDYDTGGGEFLLSLNHPYNLISATEGYPPNVELCRKKLLPLGIDFKECHIPSNIPFASDMFDLIINRHGAFHPKELYRLLHNEGVFITEQVGENNNRDLIEQVLPNAKKPFPHLNLAEQQKEFEREGFNIIRGEETYCPIKFYDVGAFVWYAHIIEWEFPNFSVDSCFDRLMELQKVVEAGGVIEGTSHRYLIVAKK